MSSPYLTRNNRLSEVIAAIQVMAIYKFYKLDFEGWADRIVGDKSQSKYWEKVFIEHPEFFRLDQTRTKASLVWRRSYPKVFNVDTRQTIARDEFLNLPDESKARISRNPLSNSDIQTLINSAISLSNLAEERNKNKGWWKPAAAALLGGGLVSLISRFL